MRKLLSALTGLLLVALPGTLLADSPRGVIFHNSGTTLASIPTECDGGVCAGDLVTCGADEGIGISRAIFSFIEGICDDAGPIPCAGKLTSLAEVCFDADPIGPDNPDFRLDGLILSITARGRFRICFDDNATPAQPADCTGDDPFYVAVGLTRVQSRALTGFPDPPNVPAEGTTELETTFSRQFFIEGHKSKFPKGITVATATAQQDFALNNCGAADTPPTSLGCGFAQTGISSTRK